MTGSSSWKHCVENAIPRQCPSQWGRRQTKAANTKASEKPFWAGVNFYWCNDIGGVRLVQMLWFWRCLQLEIERIASRCHWRRHPPHSTHTHTHTHTPPPPHPFLSLYASAPFSLQYNTLNRPVSTRGHQPSKDDAWIVSAVTQIRVTSNEASTVYCWKCLRITCCLSLALGMIRPDRLVKRTCVNSLCLRTRTHMMSLLSDSVSRLQGRWHRRTKKERWKKETVSTMEKFQEWTPSNGAEKWHPGFPLLSHPFIPEKSLE